MDKRKTTKADLERKRPFFIEIGLIVALALVFLGFEWKQYEKEGNQFETEVDYDVEEDIVLNTQREEPPKPKKQQPESQTLNIVEDDVEVEDELNIDAEADDETVVEDYEPVEVSEPEVEEQEIFTVVEEQPSFPGGEQARMKYLQENIEYPQMARESGIEGTVFVTFVVEPDGSVTDVRILRGIGGGCDEEALRVVRNMPKWKPGKQRGKSVRVQFNMPIRFKLQG
ncbi:MAG: energy transducer TonB [Bacteroidales bacterium]|nr:energy transducer TonB [Bacteroidales bacterium]MCF8327769.1 energy transducer TonB [Bacteroidales bacterium]